MQVEGQTRERSRETAKPIVQEVEDSMKRGWAEIKDAVKSVTEPSGEPHGLVVSIPMPSLLHNKDPKTLLCQTRIIAYNLYRGS